MIYILKAMLLIMGVFFSSMAIGWFLSAYEEYKSKIKSNCIKKLFFTFFPLVFWILFIYISFTFDL